MKRVIPLSGAVALSDPPSDALPTGAWRRSPRPPVELDQDHRRHAVVDLAIRDLKAGVGLRHCPSGKFAANAAWLLAALLQLL